MSDEVTTKPESASLEEQVILERSDALAWSAFLEAVLGRLLPEGVSGTVTIEEEALAEALRPYDLGRQRRVLRLALHWATSAAEAVAVAGHRGAATDAAAVREIGKWIATRLDELGAAAVELPTVPHPYRTGQAAVASNHGVLGLLSAIHNAATGLGWDDAGGQRAPTHRLRTNKGRGFVDVSIRGTDGAAVPTTDVIPTLWRELHALGDWASDALCYALAACEQRGRGPAEAFWVSIDDFLDSRGRQRITKAEERSRGWQHGHRTEDRLTAVMAFEQLKHLHVNLDVEVVPATARRTARRLKVDSQVVSITDRALQQGIDGGEVFRAARIVFGSWALAYWDEGLHQTAVLTRRALEYDPYREQPEKRLAKYLAFHFRFDAGTRRARLLRRVETLLHESSIGKDAARPQRTRDRLEKALGRLREDGVIASWSYTTDVDGLLPARRWLDQWLAATVALEPTATLAAHYQAALPVPKGN